MQILITGGSGNVGKLLIPYLIGNGHSIINYDIHVGKDIFDTAQLKSDMKNCEAVIHLAAIPHPFLKNLKESDYFHLNVEGSKKVIEACLETGVNRFIYASSGCVYGFWGNNSKIDKFPIDENNYIPSINEGNSPYGISKNMVENYLKDLTSKNKKFLAISLRMEGPGGKGTRVEWINGLHNLDNRASVYTCPAYHFFSEISRENLWQIFELCLTSSLNENNFEIFNVGNEYIHWSIDVQSWIKRNYPDILNNTKGNQALYSIEKAKKILKYRPYPVDDCFLIRENIEDFYLHQKYLGKIGKP